MRGWQKNWGVRLPPQQKQEGEGEKTGTEWRETKKKKKNNKGAGVGMQLSVKGDWKQGDGMYRSKGGGEKEGRYKKTVWERVKGLRQAMAHEGRRQSRKMQDPNGTLSSRVWDTAQDFWAWPFAPCLQTAAKETGRAWQILSCWPTHSQDRPLRVLLDGELGRVSCVTAATQLREDTNTHTLPRAAELLILSFPKGKKT